MSDLYNINGTKITIGSSPVISDGSIQNKKLEKAVDSYNIIDVEDILMGAYMAEDGSRPVQSNSRYSCSEVYYEVSGGEKYRSLGKLNSVNFYDSEKNHLKRHFMAGGGYGFEVPENASYMRITFVGTGLDTYCVYKTDCEYPISDVRKNVPSKQLDGNSVSANFYDYATPNTDTEIHRMMKCLSIKEANRRDYVLRVGSFNIYGARKGYNNWELVKKELMEWGLNICGFQEVNMGSDSEGKLKSFWSEAMTNWQFPYANDNIPDLNNSARCLLSDCEIIECEEVPYTNELESGAYANYSYLHCTVKLPSYRNGRNWNKTCSIYVAHPSVASNINQAEIAEICTAIQADTSEYKIVLADTNGFGGATEGTPFSNACQQLMAVGLHPSINDMKNPTVTDGHSEFKLNDLDCIDNVFITSNIKCKRWDIIDSKNYPDENDSGYAYVSDHCLVFADLIFDYMEEFEGE